MITESTWNALRNHEPGAIEAVANEYRPLIMTIARGIVRDEWDAEEVFQDVLLSVHYKADTVRSRAQFAPWLKQVTRNAGRMLLRKRHRIPTPLADDVMDAIRDQDAPGASANRPDEAVVHRRLVARLEERLGELPAEHRKLFLDIDVHGRSRVEVEQEMGLSTPALKSRLHRIRNSLRDAALAA